MRDAKENCESLVQCKCKCKYNISTVSSVSVRPVNKIALYKKKKGILQFHPP